MKLGIPKETKERETRVAATPASLKKLSKTGLKFCVEKNAGLAAGFSDEAYQAEGAEIVDTKTAFGCDLIFKVNRPTASEAAMLKKDALMISLFEPYLNDGMLEKLAQAGVNVMALELLPRTSRAQSMDVLSSQANIAGYRAAIEAAAHYKRFLTMMMTSAGSSKPAKVAVLGVGVAGLQAIPTIKKMGAQVEAYDIRPEVREQIVSVGAKPIDLDLGESGTGTGGYAKELSEEGKKKQQQLLSEKLKKFDIIITTANIPGRKSPVLVTEETVKGMRQGSVIIDMAAQNGGNCPLTEADQVVVKHGVTLIGHTNYPAMVPADASEFFARNLVNLIALVLQNKDGQPPSLHYNMEDDIVAGTLAVYQGQVKVKR